MPIIAALVGIVLGAIAAIAYMRTAKQGSLHEADEKIQSAHAQAESLIGDAKRQAETLKKEALLEAKEEIIKNKQAAEAEDKQRKSEIRTLENRVMQREESLDRRNDALDKREHQLSSQAGQVEKRSRELEELCAKQTSELERIADLTREDAHKELLDKVAARSPTRLPRSFASPSSRFAPSATRPPRRFCPWRFSAALPTTQPRSPLPPSTFPLMTSRAVSSVARVATSGPSSRFPASTS